MANDSPQGQLISDVVIELHTTNGAIKAVMQVSRGVDCEIKTYIHVDVYISLDTNCMLHFYPTMATRCPLHIHTSI
jgi:hypothetical protein